MKTIRRIAQALFLTATGTSFAFAAFLMLAPLAEAGRPFPDGPQCGPDRLWSCSGPGGPDILFGGTICDKEAFERKRGVTCVPFGG